MAASVRADLIGAKEALRSLNRIEPGLRKQFAQQAADIAQPAIAEAQNRYQRMGLPLSGMSRQWQSKGRKLFPYSPSRAVRGVKIKLEGDRRKTAVILIEQRDAATAIFESAGRANPNTLGDALGPLKPNRTRILGPSLYSKSEQVTREMEKAVLEIIDRVNKELA